MHFLNVHGRPSEKDVFQVTYLYSLFKTIDNRALYLIADFNSVSQYASGDCFSLGNKFFHSLQFMLIYSIDSLNVTIDLKMTKSHADNQSKVF